MSGDRRRVTNAQAAVWIAVATVVATAMIVAVVPPLATNLTTSDSRGGGWSAGPEATIVLERGAVVVAEAVAEPLPAPEAAVPQLPPAGVEQPADVDAAARAVTDALVTVFSGSNPREVRLSAIDDPSGLAPTMEEVRQRYEQASTTSEPEMGEIVFTDAGNASFLFRLRYVGAPLLPARVGRARLVDGRWMITRSTLCEVLQTAGSTCPPPAPAFPQT